MFFPTVLKKKFWLLVPIFFGVEIFCTLNVWVDTPEAKVTAERELKTYETDIIKAMLQLADGQLSSNIFKEGDGKAKEKILKLTETVLQLEKRMKQVGYSTASHLSQMTPTPPPPKQLFQPFAESNTLYGGVPKKEDVVSDVFPEATVIATGGVPEDKLTFQPFAKAKTPSRSSPSELKDSQLLQGYKILLSSQKIMPQKLSNLAKKIKELEPLFLQINTTVNPDTDKNKYFLVLQKQIEDLQNKLSLKNPAPSDNNPKIAEEFAALQRKISELLQHEAEPLIVNNNSAKDMQQNMVRQLQAKITELEETLEFLTTEVSKEKQELAVADEETKKLKSQLSQKKTPPPSSKQTNLEKQLAKSTKTAEALQYKLQTKDQALEDLKNEIKYLTAEKTSVDLSEMAAQFLALQKSIAELSRMQSESLVAKNSVSEEVRLAAIPQLQSKIAGLEISLQSFATEVSKKQQDLDTAIKKITELGNQLSQKNTPIPNAEKPSLNKQSSLSAASVKNLQDQLQVKSQSLEDLENRIKKLTAEIASTDSSKAAEQLNNSHKITEQLAALQKSFDELSLPQQKTLIEKNSVTVAMQPEIADQLQAKITKLEKTLESLTTEVSKEKQELAIAVEETKRLNSQLLQKKAPPPDSEQSNLEKQLEESTKTAKDLQDQLQTKNQDLEDLKNKIKYLTAKKTSVDSSEMATQFLALQKSIAELSRTQSESLVAKNSVSEEARLAAIPQLQSKITGLETSLQSFATEVSKKQQILDTAIEKITELEKQLSQKNTTIPHAEKPNLNEQSYLSAASVKILQDQLQVQDKSLEDLNNKIKKLTAEIASTDSSKTAEQFANSPKIAEQLAALQKSFDELSLLQQKSLLEKNSVTVAMQPEMVRQLQSKIIELKETIESLTTELSDKQQELAVTARKAIELESQLSQKNTPIPNSEKLELEKQLATSATTIKSLQDQLQVKSQSLEDLENRIKKLTTEIATASLALETKEEGFQEQQANLNKKLLSQQEALTQAKASQSKTSSALKVKSQQLKIAKEDALKKQADHESQLAEVSLQQQQNQKDVNILIEAMNASVVKINGLKSTINSLEGGLLDKKNKLQQINRQLELAHEQTLSTNSEIITAAEEKIKSLETQVADLTAELKDASSDKEQDLAQTKELEQRVTDLQQEIATNKTELEKTKLEADKEKQENTAATQTNKNALEKIERELHDIKTESSQTKAQLEEALKDKTNLSHKLAEAEQRLHSAEQEITRLNQALNQSSNMAQQTLTARDQNINKLSNDAMQMQRNYEERLRQAAMQITQEQQQANLKLSTVVNAGNQQLQQLATTAKNYEQLIIGLQNERQYLLLQLQQASQYITQYQNQFQMQGVRTQAQEEQLRWLQQNAANNKKSNDDAEDLKIRLAELKQQFNDKAMFDLSGKIRDASDDRDNVTNIDVSVNTDSNSISESNDKEDMSDLEDRINRLETQAETIRKTINDHRVIVGELKGSFTKKGK